MLGSRTDGALVQESSWPKGTRTVPASLVCGAALWLSLSGCSAVNALAETHRAERALLSTRVLRETPAAIYALTLSRAYLDKAREEAAEAQYGGAIFYAKAAARAAQDAQRTQLARLAFVSNSDRAVLDEVRP